MPFRFNQKDLAVFACNRTAKFKKEGLLWFKEKEGKLFNKTESFSERLVRLYGNLLFYFKGKDITSECAGVIVLEKYKIVPDSSVKEFGFFIQFYVDDEHRYEFAADHKEDYNEWVTLLKQSSLDKLSKRLQVLCTEIQSLTEEDPFPDYHPVISLDNLKTATNRMSLFTHHGDGDDVNDAGLLTEICISGSNLMAVDEHMPCPMIHVFTVVPPSTKWMKHSQTEIYEKSKDPVFLRTIVFASTFPPITRIKFVVHDVLSKVSSRTDIIGQIVCTLQDIQKAPDLKISYNIANADGKICGSINILGWKRTGVSHSVQMSNVSEIDFGAGEGSERSLTIQGYTDFTDQHKRRFFRVPTTDGHDMKFQDILMETTLCFKVPKLLLSLFIQEEKDGVVELHSIGNLHPQWDILKEGAQNNHIDRMQQYSTNLADLCQFEGLNIKKSIEKAKKELAFIPTNLHLQRLAVTEIDDTEHFYDIITMGAPAAHSLKFKQGGLKRLCSACDDYARKTMQSDGEEDMRRAKYANAQLIRENLQFYKHEILQLLTIVKKEIDKPAQLTESTTQVSMKIGELLTIISTTFIKECEEELTKARTSGPELRFKSTVISSGIDDANYNKLNWEWSGLEYKAVRSSTLMPYDCNVCDTLGRFMGAVNQAFSSQKSDYKDLLVLLDRLEKSVKSLIGKTNVLMRFAMMKNQQIDSSTISLRYRKDIVFSQTLAPVVAGFDVLLSTKITDTKIMEQLSDIGLLVHFESLLTTGGDEMGMLEDMYTGLTMLKTVNFEIVSSETCSEPTLSGTRGNLVVVFHVHQNLFQRLPSKLRGNGTIKLHPILFSVGINEQATVAERFGDTSLQETINNESLQYLQLYFDELKRFDPKFSGSRSSKSVSLDRLMSQLQLTVNTKKIKNYDILLLAEEISMRMNGIRLTSCKSAKDRSSMSVTLEMVKILEREHEMREDVFQRVLDSLRSQGTRLINSYKNVGIPKYAFNKVQVKALPSIYRPPEGTIGKYIQT